jgi:DNA-binding CsgD family transcriptional regulator
MSSMAQPSSLVCSGRHILKPEQWRQIQRSLQLSAREHQIAQHIFDDNKAEYIAEDLGISVHTVNTYLQRLYFKLEVRSRSQLVLCILKKHLEHLAKAGESQVKSFDLHSCGEPGLEHVVPISDARNHDLRAK